MCFLNVFSSHPFFSVLCLVLGLVLAHRAQEAFCKRAPDSLLPTKATLGMCNFLFLNFT